MKPLPFSRERRGGEQAKRVTKREEWKKEKRVQEQTRGEEAVGDISGKIGKVGEEKENEEG